MTQTQKIALRLPLRALRLHKHVPSAPVAVAADDKRAWLLSLREKSAQAETDRQALQVCVESIGQALAQIAPMVQQNLEQISAVITELGLVVAREVLGDAVDKGLLDPTQAVRRCLQQMISGVDKGELRVLLNPDDLSQVIAELEHHPEFRGKTQDAEFVPSPSIQRGSAQVESGSGRMLYDPLEVYERIADEIRKEAQT